MSVVSYGKKRLTKSGAENYVRRLIQDSRTKKGEKLTNLNMYIAFINSKQGNPKVQFFFPHFYKAFTNTRSHQGVNIKNYIRTASTANGYINQYTINKWQAAFNANKAQLARPYSGALPMSESGSNRNAMRNAMRNAAARRRNAAERKLEIQVTGKARAGKGIKRRRNGRWKY